MKTFVVENTSLFFGWGNGYVAIPKGNPFWGKNYTEIPDNSRRVTFSAPAVDLDWIPEGLEECWIVGFDTFGAEHWKKEHVEDETEDLRKLLERYSHAINLARLFFLG